MKMRIEIEEDINKLFKLEDEKFIKELYRLFGDNKTEQHLVFSRLNLFKKISENKRQLIFSRLQYVKEYYDNTSFFTVLNGFLLAILLLYLTSINVMLPGWIENVQMNSKVQENERLPLVVYKNITNVDLVDTTTYNPSKIEHDPEVKSKLLSSFLGIGIYLGILFLLWHFYMSRKKLKSMIIYLENLLYK